MLLPFLLLLSSCSLFGGPQSQPSQQAINEVETPENALIALLEEATGDGQASAEQLGLLSGEGIDYGAYEQAVRRTHSCLSERKVDVQDTGTITHQGATVLTYSFSSHTLNDADLDKAFWDCSYEHSYYVEAYWQASSPIVYEYTQRRAEALKPAMFECLESAGLDVPQDASFEDLERLALPGYMNAAKGDASAVDCYKETGFDTWQG